MTIIPTEATIIAAGSNLDRGLAGMSRGTSGGACTMTSPSFKGGMASRGSIQNSIGR